MAKIGFLGFGNMASSIANGILNSKTLKKELKIFAYDPIKEIVLNNENVEYLTVKEIVTKCEYVFLAVKPQIMNTLLEEIKEFINHNVVFISIAAGISSKNIKNILGDNTKLMMVMPNTPLKLGIGATAIANNDDMCFRDFKLVCDIFEASGEICLLDESKMKEIIPVAASGVGFMYYIAKQFIEYAKENDIDEDVARKMIAQTLIGGGKMLMTQTDTVDELINNVCSKGGTTIAGIEKMQELGLDTVIKEALNSCKNRAYELGE